MDGYNDLTKCFLWEWNEAKLGPLFIDSDRTFFFDGQNFMYRIEGHPDDEVNAATCESMSLELWLVEQTDRRDPEVLKDQKCYYTSLWHEFLRITRVNIHFKTLDQNHGASIFYLIFKNRMGIFARYMV